jgi:hypothetical protein
MFTSAMGNSIGRPAIRLYDFTKKFADHGLFQTICTADYSPALTKIGQLLFNAISPCLEGPIDTVNVDPNFPDHPPQCTVSDVQVGQAEQLIPHCQMASATMPSPTATKPCWWVEKTASCTTQTQLKIHIERNGAPPTGTEQVVSCATAPT